MKVKNLKSIRSGREVANQFVIIDDEHKKVVFQSYNSTCCIIDNINHTITFGQHWNYSKTTIKYLLQFLREYAPYINFEWNTKKINRLIIDGTFYDVFNNDWAIVFTIYLK